MESGALSDPAFPAFSAQVIPYLHVTTRIEGHPHDGLLKEKGFGGFPSLCFMDASGTVIAKQGDRSVKGFEKTLGLLQEVATVKKAIADGQKGMEFKLLLAEWRLGTMDWPTTQSRAKALANLTAKEKDEVAQLLLDAEVLHLAANTTKPEEFESTIVRFKEILAAGKPMPSAWSERAFWSLLLRKAEMEPVDVELFEKGVAAMKRILADNPGMKAYLDKLDARLAELKAPGA